MYDYDDQRATTRNISRASYEETIEQNWTRDHIDIKTTLPRALPPFPSLADEENQQLADIRPSAPPLKGIRGYDVEACQTTCVLYTTRSLVVRQQEGMARSSPDNPP